jgi:hypothetical protein
MYVIIATADNKVVPFIVGVSEHLTGVHYVIEERLNLAIKDLTKFESNNDEDEEYNIPFEFSEVEDAKFNGSYVLTDEQWKKIALPIWKDSTSRTKMLTILEYTITVDIIDLMSKIQIL